MKQANIVAIILFLSVPLFALADYPTISGRTITSDSTFSDYVVYYFSLALIIGIIAAVVVLIIAGIKFLFSQGDTSKRSDAKRMITGAFIGLIVLFGSYALLNSLNPSATEPIVEPEPAAFDGIYLIKENGSKVLVSQDIPETSQNFTGIEWISSAEDLPAIYLYTEKYFKGVPKEITNGTSVSIPKGSSISLLWKTAGIYLYDKVNYQLGSKSAPLPIKFSQAFLGGNSFDNITQSIKINQPSDGSTLGAILFPEDDYRGTCSWILGEIPDLNQSRGEENNPPIGNNNLSSIIVLKLASGSPTVTFYNRANCQYVQKDPRSKKCDVSTINKTSTFKESCPDFTGDVLSFSLNEDTGVLLKTENGQCQFFKRQNSPQECLSLIKYGYVYNPDPKKAIKPYSFTIFSLAK